MSAVTIAILVLTAIVLIVILTTLAKVNAFISLFLVSLFLAIVALPGKDVIAIMKDGFGSTMGSIGFLIIFGAIIAIVLERSGGAVSIAGAILKKTGTHNAAPALAITGFITGFPIFCDSGFIIMSGLAKTFSSRSKIALSFLAITLATSLYSVHCLIPTHPGSLAAAGIIGVNLGTLILWGFLFAIPATIAAYYFTKWQTRNHTTIAAETVAINDPLTTVNLPPVSIALLPVVLPLALILYHWLLF